MHALYAFFDLDTQTNILLGFRRFRTYRFLIAIGLRKTYIKDEFRYKFLRVSVVNERTRVNNACSERTRYFDRKRPDILTFIQNVLERRYRIKICVY